MVASRSTSIRCRGGGPFRFAFGVHVPIQVDNALIKRATGGPKRFRPKIREELELEVGSQRGAASDGCVRVSCGVAWGRARSCNN